jgi:hypothetical protein
LSIASHALPVTSSFQEFDSPSDQIERRTVESLLTTTILSVSIVPVITGHLLGRAPEDKELFRLVSTSYPSFQAEKTYLSCPSRMAMREYGCVGSSDHQSVLRRTVARPA